MKKSQPVPVSSCWNGLGEFYNRSLSYVLSSREAHFLLCFPCLYWGCVLISSTVFMPASTFTGENGSSFRGIDDSLAEYHLEASECCLIHADNPASDTRGVFLNPNVRVGYDSHAYKLVHRNGSWLSRYEIWVGLWRNRFRRWFTTPLLKEHRVRKIVNDWRRQKPGRKEQGEFCMIDEMQVLVENGWAHV